MEDFIADNLIRDYEQRCTRRGRFPILSSAHNMFIISSFFGIFSMLIAYKYFVHTATGIYYSFLLGFFLSIISYIIIMDRYIFKYTKQKFIEQIIDNKDKRRKLKEIEKYQYSFKLIYKSNWIEKEYIDSEFLKCVETYGLNNDMVLLDKVINIINKKRKKNMEFTDIINFALIGTLSYPALKPLYAYLQNTIIPLNSKVFDLFSVINYGFIIFVIIILVMIVYLFITFLNRILIKQNQSKNGYIDMLLKRLIKLKKGIGRELDSN